EKRNELSALDDHGELIERIESLAARTGEAPRHVVELEYLEIVFHVSIVPAKAGTQFATAPLPSKLDPGPRPQALTRDDAAVSNRGPRCAGPLLDIRVISSFARRPVGPRCGMLRLAPWAQATGYAGIP